MTVVYHEDDASLNVLGGKTIGYYRIRQSRATCGIEFA